MLWTSSAVVASRRLHSINPLFIDSSTVQVTLNPNIVLRTETQVNVVTPLPDITTVPHGISTRPTINTVTEYRNT